MAYQSFEDLEVWQRGCRLSVSIFQTFEGCKNFTLKDQIGRASLSIPCNIAERRKLKLLNKPDFETGVAETKEISAMLEGLRRSMLAKTRPKLKRARRRKLKA